MRNTEAHRKIWELLNQGEALSAQSIQEKLPDYNLSTVYRNLKRFVTEGKVREVNVSNEKVLFEILHNDHQHAICTDCGKLIHLDLNKKEFIKALHLEGFDIQDVEVIIKGKCVSDK